jgi:tRNA A37 methylthiotransferase MiaB
VQDCCETFGVEFKTGVDYTDFAGAKTIARLSLSSGCSHKCKFCIVPDNVTKTPIADVYQNADEICRLNSPLVYIDDKTFGQAENFWLLPRLFGYIARNMSATFDGFIVQTTASQLLRLDDDFLLASGVRYVELGIETYNNSILAAMHKPATEKLIDAATEKLRRLGIKLIPNILIGLPDETIATYSNTLNWLDDNADVISHVNVYNLVVYADAELADEIEFADKDFDENSIGKSWHTDTRLHEIFADRVNAFGMQCLDG